MRKCRVATLVSDRSWTHVLCCISDACSTGHKCQFLADIDLTDCFLVGCRASAIPLRSCCPFAVRYRARRLASRGSTSTSTRPRGFPPCDPRVLDKRPSKRTACPGEVPRDASISRFEQPGCVAMYSSARSCDTVTSGATSDTSEGRRLRQLLLR